jgi:methionyl-tRNA synthetase
MVPCSDSVREEGTDVISLEEFRRIDLRVGEILEAELVTGSSKLLKVTVDLGRERRTLVGGLAQSYSAEELRGQKVIVAANLAPARIRGVESQGMLLGVGCEDTKSIALLTVNRHAPNGAPVE